MMNRFKKMMRSEEGQGMTEYIIIVALIAIAAIGVITIFGQNIKALFATSANVLGGTANTTVRRAGATTGNTTKRSTISNFADTNDTK